MPQRKKRQLQPQKSSSWGGGAKVSKKEDNDESSKDEKEAKQKKLTNVKIQGTMESATNFEDSKVSDTKSIYFDDENDNLRDTDSKSRISASFYQQSCEDLAKALLGQVLVRKEKGSLLSGRIVETEAYLGKRDKAAHSYKGKTDRNAAMFMDPGTAYVYNIYGMYCCMNISSQGEGEAVLIRALEPVQGQDTMQKLRSKSQKKPGSKALKEKDLCNGPSKLTQALNIDKASINKVDMSTDENIWLEKGDVIPASKMVVSKRINIAYAEEWTDKPLRFYELGNTCVSVKDKEEEAKMKSMTS